MVDKNINFVKDKNVDNKNINFVKDKFFLTKNVSFDKHVNFNIKFKDIPPDDLGD